MPRKSSSGYTKFRYEYEEKKKTHSDWSLGKLKCGYEEKKMHSDWSLGRTVASFLVCRLDGDRFDLALV